MSPRLRLVGAAAAAALLCVGCGGGSSRADPPSGQHPVDRRSTPLPAATVAHLLASCPRAEPDPGAAPGRGRPVPAHPTGAVACLTGEPPGKRRAGAAVPADVAAALARIVDRAPRATPTQRRADRRRCGPAGPVGLVRFRYPRRVVDIEVPVGCHTSDVRAPGPTTLRLPRPVADLVQGWALAGGDAAPAVVGESLTRAEATVVRRHERLIVLGEVPAPPARPGTVLLAAPVDGGEVDVVLASGAPPRCTDRDLSVRFVGGEPSAGSDMVTLLLSVHGGRWCTVGRAIRVVGTRDGDPDTHPVVVRSRTPFELGPGLGQSLLLASPYRDDPAAAGGSCEPHWVVPAAWSLRLGSVTLSVADGEGVADGLGQHGLVTCRGDLEAGPVLAQSPPG